MVFNDKPATELFPAVPTTKLQEPLYDAKYKNWEVYDYSSPQACEDDASRPMREEVGWCTAPYKHDIY